MAGALESEGIEGRKIVVAVDDGEESTYALQWCLRNIAANSASTNARDTLVLVFARPAPPVFSAMDGTGKLSFHCDLYCCFPFGRKKDWLYRLQILI
jgi:Universal stress protein family